LRRFDVPIGAFTTNVSAEAIRQTDSLLYHEEEGFHSGTLGYVKPFTSAVYGDYELVEGIGRQLRSPLDIHYEEIAAWTGQQWGAYARATLTTFKSCLRSDHWSTHSPVLYRAVDNFKGIRFDEALGAGKSFYKSEGYVKLHAVVNFLISVIDEIDKMEAVPAPVKLRQRGPNGRSDKYDDIAQTIVDVMFTTVSADLSEDESWGILHNALWSRFFSFGHNGKAWQIIQFKIRRLLFDEITDSRIGLNYKSARLLGLCLYVMGLKPLERSKRGIHRDEAALSQSLIAWTKDNYMRYVEERPEVAKRVLVGSLTFDKDRKRLTKSYILGLNKEMPKEYLELKEMRGAVPTEIAQIK
jgi:hypothetical protein